MLPWVPLDIVAHEVGRWVMQLQGGLQQHLSVVLRQPGTYSRITSSNQPRCVRCRCGRLLVRASRMLCVAQHSPSWLLHVQFTHGVVDYSARLDGVLEPGGLDEVGVTT